MSCFDLFSRFSRFLILHLLVLLIVIVFLVPVLQLQLASAAEVACLVIAISKVESLPSPHLPVMCQSAARIWMEYGRQTPAGKSGIMTPDKDTLAVPQLRMPKAAEEEEKKLLSREGTDQCYCVVSQCSKLTLSTVVSTPSRLPHPHLVSACIGSALQHLYKWE